MLQNWRHRGLKLWCSSVLNLNIFVINIRVCFSDRAMHALVRSIKCLALQLVILSKVIHCLCVQALTRTYVVSVIYSRWVLFRLGIFIRESPLSVSTFSNLFYSLTSQQLFKSLMLIRISSSGHTFCFDRDVVIIQNVFAYSQIIGLFRINQAWHVMFLLLIRL